MANKNFNAAKEAKKDEFYTQLIDIENKLRHYREHFREKAVEPSSRTARCFAENATEGKEQNKKEKTDTFLKDVGLPIIL